MEAFLPFLGLSLTFDKVEEVRCLSRVEKRDMCLSCRVQDSSEFGRGKADVFICYDVCL